MAIVHPAFCGIVADTMEPIHRSMIPAVIRAFADTKHCKNRVYGREALTYFRSRPLLTTQVSPQPEQ
jgi:hypothetical protein